jgi:hypothetical protein
MGAVYNPDIEGYDPDIGGNRPPFPIPEAWEMSQCGQCIHFRPDRWNTYCGHEWVWTCDADKKMRASDEPLGWDKSCEGYQNASDF